ncbi:MAG: P-loop NTPase [Ilumatobacter sp.]
MSSGPIIAVVSPKGGNGKTTVSSNVAVALAARAQPILIDLDVHFGDVEYALRLRPTHRLDHAVERLTEHSSADLEALLSDHPSGVAALCAPSDPVAADRLTAAQCFSVVDRLSETGRPVVLDTAGGIGDHTLEALDRASHVLLVSGTDVPSVHAGRKLLDTMERLGMHAPETHLIVNRSTARVGLGVADVEAVLGLRAALEVPEHSSVAAAMNQGSPLVESTPGSPIARAFSRFAGQLLGAEGPRRHGPWSRLVGRA